MNRRSIFKRALAALTAIVPPGKAVSAAVQPKQTDAWKPKQEWMKQRGDCNPLFNGSPAHWD